MVRFLVSKDLLFLTNFSATSLDEVKDFAAVDVNSILAALKQCPNYQVDRHHTNCGLRTRLMPILEYVTSMISASVVQVNLQGWKRERRKTSWQKPEGGEDQPKGRLSGKKDFVVGNETDDGNSSQSGRVFRFTRAVASDQRLRYEGAIAADKMARGLFTAEEWDWTPEDIDETGPDLEVRHLSMPLRRK